MSNEASARIFAEQLERAIDGNDWRQVDLCRERLKMLLLDATIDTQVSTIALVEAALGRARGKLVFGRDINVSPSPDGAAWMLAADLETARLASRIRPRPPAGPLQRSSREQIIAALKTVNRGGLSNRQIERRTGLRAETVARTLKVLRAEGHIKSRRVGRFTVNRLAGFSAISLVARVKAIVEQNSEMGQPLLLPLDLLVKERTGPTEFSIFPLMAKSVTPTAMDEVDQLSHLPPAQAAPSEEKPIVVRQVPVVGKPNVASKGRLDVSTLKNAPRTASDYERV